MIARTISGRQAGGPYSRIAIIAGVFAILILLGMTGPVHAQDGTRPRSPRYCGRCHEEAYAHWAESAHNLEAFQGERFQSVWARQREAPECLACHTTQLGEGDETVTYNAVTCGACHKPAGEDYDPAERDHVTMSIPENSRSCAGCHGEGHALTFTEWASSPHNAAREVGCFDCHDAHTGGLTHATLKDLCDSCHNQPVPTTSAHMFIESGCTDCHPAPIKTDNIHMGGAEPVAECTACHMVTQMEEWGRWLDSAGHSMTVPLAACVNCHGELHMLGSTAAQAE